MTLKKHEKSLKVKYEKVLNAEISNHKFAGSLTNTSLLMANMRKLKTVFNRLNTENTDPFQAFAANGLFFKFSFCS